MKYHPDLEQLKVRFETFTEKLLAKADDLEAEAKMSAQTVYDEDPDHHKRAYGQFKMGIEGQFKGLIQKTNDVFNQQIRPLRDTSQYDNREWFSELYDQLSAFEANIRQKMKNVFGDVIKISNEVYLQNILKEYEKIKDAFNCKQCSANLSIDQIYFVSTYITCPFCQTQNTFVPGTKMTQLEGLSRDLAEERLQYIKNQYLAIEHKAIDKLVKTGMYLFYRAYVWVEKSKVVPIYKDSYLKIFLRELHDSVSGSHSKKLEIKTDVYHYILQRLGFSEEMKPMVLEAYTTKDFESTKAKLIDWEMLMQLSSVTITSLYQGSQHQQFHENQFERIQSEWTIISNINKALEKNEMALDEAIDIIRLKIN